jgi:hypothetical protein
MRALVREIEVRNGPGQDLPEDWFNDKIDQVCASLCVRSASRQPSRSLSAVSWKYVLQLHTRTHIRHPTPWF